MSFCRRSALVVLTLLSGVWACSDDEDGDQGSEESPATGSDASQATDSGPARSDGGTPVAEAGTGGNGRDGGGGTIDGGGGAIDGGPGAPTLDAAPSGRADAAVRVDGGGQVEPGVTPLPLELALPIVFIHGFSGSAQQYESQAMRFIANGYPADRIRAYEHDGLGTDIAGFANGADAFIDAVRREFSVDKIYLVAHSRGTSVSNTYLGDPARAAKVAKYVALDGRPCPTVVPCLAPNQMNLPGQAHVEVATSPESFARQFEFLIGRAPSTTQIVAQTTPVVISGRAVNFPANTGRAGTVLKIWELVAATGARAAATPAATFDIGTSGDWGPATVSPDKHYELELSTPGGNTHHFYPQRFLRNDAFVRLLSGPPDSPARMNTNVSDRHAAVTVSRQREWMGMDVLEVSTTSASGGNQPAVNAIQSFIATRRAIGIAIHDDAASPGQSSLMPLPWFSMQAFQAGVDIFMPAANPTDGTITFRSLPRGDTTQPQVLNVPNWPSSTHAISVVFSDFPQP